MTNASQNSRIHPVILSGGAGVRLWPMSREQYPKQFLPLCSERSMLQDTAGRVSDAARFADPLIVCNQEHRFVIAEQMRQTGRGTARIVLEPVGRNTAPAAAVAALIVAEQDPDGQILLLPADHAIQDQDAFLQAVATASAAAASGHLATFGIVPTAPETGYGYIRRGGAVEGHGGAFRVAAFVEKPPREQAERYLAEKDFFWNSGMFLLPVRQYLAELERWAPAVLEACRTALARGRSDLDFFRLDEEAFAASPNISIDYAVMERTEAAAVVPCSIGWTDVGAWSALWEIGVKDQGGNVCHGDAVTWDSRGCYVRSEDGALVALLGMEDTVVVATEDAILVAAKDRAQDIKPLVEHLKTQGRSEPLLHRRVHRPWGFYQSLHAGDRFQVKRLTVSPGARLSLQKHYHRAEHWVVVNGTALVTRGDEQILLRENESVYIPLGTPHRLENPGKVPLNLIEVQSGSYLGEDDIVRFDDHYGRS
ncbi:mannose-1-phosphate guanylyltransferase/mannose-6-phosphate isomerase [Azospirillum brasilense]|uniref:mannose-1-phosphate guanylyltransferase/mannose-6-phosphate isomerase n=1 Tax=Azospirillum brasilense TaxID=192 RepID=UPI000E67A0D7|nr:mannose-1-phosphate guanylyltransferase/mannose-6-phosphate isomerase [Azospirillum brasilense]NUB24865.1 mannose-1-phosphate guanylyltransferase/mannose-6-phosphate isomerase [Azospirillum brasilense]NUB32540.1 mannose-1-phosphate guanylyltransferase/mannose-6-phosphate isomerase [Azospirillum brasilense]RIW02092.1 mannose-1-phosphate guanylyltransferase/mannose-6-phosphate isomerase [Azospirillum brasilense]